MQARTPRHAVGDEVSRQQSPPIALVLALAVLLGCAIVVWAHRVPRAGPDDPALSRAVSGGVTPAQIERLVAEGEGLQAEIQAVSERLAADPRASSATRPEGPLIRARFATRTALELVRKMEAAIERDRGFLARHLLGEAHLAFREARTNLDRAKRGLAVR